MTDDRWRIIFREVGGHRVFRFVGEGPNRGRLAIADRSGSTPDMTDDGVIWLPPCGIVRVGNGGALIIDVTLGDDEEPSSVIVSTLFAYWLVSAKGWALRLSPGGVIETIGGVAVASME